MVTHINSTRILLFFFIVTSLVACSDSNSPGTTPVDNNNIKIKTKPLSVTSITPNNDTNNVDRKLSITIVFSDNIDGTNIKNIISIKDQFENSIETGEINVTDNSIIIHPLKKLFRDSAYTVTVSKQLASVNGGKLAKDFISVFTTQNAAWSTSTPFFESGGFSQSAINDIGDIISVTWTYNKSTGNYEIIMYQKTGGIWTNGKVISSATQVYNPKVVMDNNANAIITWEKTFQNEIVVLEFRDGSWGTPWIISSTNVKNSIAMNDNGYAVITWAENTNVYMAEYSNAQWKTSVFSTQTKPNTPQIKLNNNGQGVITWKHGADFDSTAVIYASPYEQKTWGAPTVISNTSDILPVYNFALDENGDVIIVWGSNNNGAGNIAYKNEYRNSIWQGFKQFNPTSGITNSPQVSMSKNGTAIVAWGQYTTTTLREIAFTEFKNNAWSAITIAGVGYKPQVTTDDRGDGIIVWENDAITHKELLMSQSFGGKWADATLFSVSDNKLNGMEYEMSMTNSGDIILVWSQSVNSTWFQYRATFK